MTVDGPPRATLILDDTEVGQTPLEHPLTVSAGPHQVEARAEGYLPSRREVTVAGETTALVELTLQPVAPAPLTEPTVDVADEPVAVDAGREQTVEPRPLPDSPSLERARRLRVGAWITGALSLVALGVSAGLLIWNAGVFDDWQSDRAALDGDAASTSSQSAALTELEARYAQSDEGLDEVQTVDAWSWSVFGLGAACLVASVGLFLGARRLDRDASSRPRLSVAPTLGGGNVTLRF